MTIKETVEDIRAAAIAGIDRFISKAKREQRQAVEISAWNAEVEARKRAKLEEKRRRKVWGIGLDESTRLRAGQVKEARK